MDSSFIETKLILKSVEGDVFGTLLTPEKVKRFPLAIIIAGSGPTDKDGNNILGVKTNSYKKLAFNLVENKIATLRFDKRGVGESTKALKNESEITIDSYISDVINWIKLFRKDTRISSIILIGHSEGALIGMIASKYADSYVSIAGAGKPCDSIINEQIATQPTFVKEKAIAIFDSLKQGLLVKDIPQYFMSIFRPSVQPYMISWLKYNPQVEIQKIIIPILLIQGTKDLQLGEDNICLLSKNNKNAKVILIQNMNHIFATISGDEKENINSYNNIDLPINATLIKELTKFILQYTR